MSPLICITPIRLLYSGTHFNSLKEVPLGGNRLLHLLLTSPADLEGKWVGNGLMPRDSQAPTIAISLSPLAGLFLALDYSSVAPGQSVLSLSILTAVALGRQKLSQGRSRESPVSHLAPAALQLPVTQTGPTLTPPQGFPAFLLRSSDLCFRLTPPLSLVHILKRKPETQLVKFWKPSFPNFSTINIYYLLFFKIMQKNSLCLFVFIKKEGERKRGNGD